MEIKKISLLLALPFLLLLCEWIYFDRVYHEKSGVARDADMILVYSGSDDRIQALSGLIQPQNNPVFLFSGWDFAKTNLEKRLKLDPALIQVEDRARTTDQNARYSAPMILQRKVHNILLALPWYQLPRALFLTRFYLAGSGVSVEPYASIPLPDRWWKSSLFGLEMVKFWGSLFRVSLAWLGVEDWPKHEWGLSRS